MRSSFIRGEWETGQKVGKLTITSLHPFRQVCECGTPTAVTRSAILLAGVRSCGCGSPRNRGSRFVKGAEIGIYTLVERAEGRRKWHVLCRKCNRSQTITECALRYSTPRRCRQCDL